MALTTGDLRLVLAHSPYLGPSSWAPTARAMVALGHPTEVLDLRIAATQEPAAASYIAAATRRLDDGATPGPLALIGHSRSGPMLPAIASRTQQLVAMVVYVDAALPHPGRSSMEIAPPDRVAMMRRLIVDGRLPRWSDWWDDPAVVERLLPEPGLRQRIVEEQPQLPASFLDERMPADTWDGPTGYLQLSTAYREYADTAQSSGWRVERRDLDHLAVATAPVTVAEAIEALLAGLGQGC